MNRRKPSLRWQHESPRAAYIHIPFCVYQCGYCNFTVIAGRDRERDGSYLSSLESEMKFRLEQPHPVETVFIGGGTPSELFPQNLRTLGTILDRWLPRETGHETTMEANPENVDLDRVAAMREIGVNRLSLGVQSFQPRKLKSLERIHKPEELARAYELAHTHFEQVSIDLMFAAPGETLAEWESDLDRAIQACPEHISTYGLTIEPETRFMEKRTLGYLEELSDSLYADMYRLAIQRLTSAGYEHYEISNFALPGGRCRHNENYWLGRPYFGFGIGASRYVGGYREKNHASLTRYIRETLLRRFTHAERERISEEDSARERLVFGLRRLEGIDCEDFLLETGYRVDDLGGEALRHFRDQGWLDYEDGILRLTPEGLLISDGLWPELIVSPTESTTPDAN